MARKARDPQQQEQEPTGVYESSPAFPARVDVVDASAELIEGSPMMPSAVERDGAEVAAEVEGPARYRVLSTQYVMSRGGRTLMRAGKIVDAHNFDIPALASQGVQLEAIA